MERWVTSLKRAFTLTNPAIPQVTLSIPANTAIQFKFLRKANGQVTWQSDPNNAYTIPASGTYVINENWR